MVTKEQVQELLDELAEIESAKDIHRLALDEARKKIIPQDIQDQLEQLDAEFGGKIEIADEKAKALKEQIKEMVLSMPKPETIKGAEMSAQFRRGSIKWDDRGLVKLAADYPMLFQYRQEGNPTVAFVVNR